MTMSHDAPDQLGPAAANVDPIHLRVVDFRQLRSPNSSERAAAVQSLDAAFQETGFVQICNHTIPPDRVQSVLEWARRFFTLSEEEKEKVARPNSGGLESHVGWAKVGVGNTVDMVFDADELEKQRTIESDFNETLNIANPSRYDGPTEAKSKANSRLCLLEHVLPGLHQLVEGWWEECAELALMLLDSLSEALQIRNPRYLREIHANHDVCHMAWNHYPAMSRAKVQADGPARMRAHTDFGTLSLVFQDTVGGLEINDGHQFRPVVFVPGAVVLNVGDMLEQQSNGRWKSALHRVVANKQADDARGLDSPSLVDDVVIPERYSLAFFAGPSPDVLIQTLPGCEKPGRWPPNMVGDWGQMSARQWIDKRVAAEYQ